MLNVDNMKFTDMGWNDMFNIFFFDMIELKLYTIYFFHISFIGRSKEEAEIKHLKFVKKFNKEL